MINCEKWGRYLEGLEPDMPQEFVRLAETLEHQVFELWKSPAKEYAADYFVPYMMNDAVEDYLILKNCRMTGEFVSGSKEEAKAQIARSENGYVLIVRQGTENVFTLHFEEIEEKIQCYQYHQIGHFWVEGAEQWRQLVYILGTIYDKYEYLGENYCNAGEIELLRLMEFAPFRFWSPICESLDEYYPSTSKGTDTMEKLAREAGDMSYVRMLQVYRAFSGKKYARAEQTIAGYDEIVDGRSEPGQMNYRWNGILRKRLEKVLSKRLLHPKREALYQLIYEKIQHASEGYSERNYDAELNEKIKEIRRDVQEMLLQKGFHGTYPEYRKDNMQVIVTEEHPFTIMEYDDFEFSVRFMVSECNAAKEKHDSKSGMVQSGGRNSGFFKGKGRRGWITSKVVSEMRERQ